MAFIAASNCSKSGLNLKDVDLPILVTTHQHMKFRSTMLPCLTNRDRYGMNEKLHQRTMRHEHASKVPAAWRRRCVAYNAVIADLNKSLNITR